MTFTSGRIGGASLFARNSSSTTYYRGIADVYLSARTKLIDDNNFYFFESGNPGLLDTALKKQVCYQAALDQMGNESIGAAMDPYYRKPLDYAGNQQYDPNENTTKSLMEWVTVSTLSYTPPSDKKICLYQVEFKAKTSLGNGATASYEIRCQKAGESEIVLATGSLSYPSYTTISHSCNVWGKPGQQITVKFRVYILSPYGYMSTVWTKDYYMRYGLQQKWSGWNEWYNTIVRPISYYESPGGLYWSSLRIDNYEPSLYMGTVQGYIQGLEQGSINKNCTFIDIRGTGYYFWENNKLKQKQMVTYKALNGKYYTHVTIVEGDIYGSGPKDITFQIGEGPTPFVIDTSWISLGVSVISTVFYFGTKLGWFALPGWVSPSLTVVKLTISDALGKIFTCFGWYVNTVNTPKTMSTVSKILGTLVDFGQINVGTILGTVGSVAAIWLSFFGIGCAIGGIAGLSGPSKYYFGAAFASFATLAVIVGLSLAGDLGIKMAALLGISALTGGFGLVLVAILLVTIGIVCILKIAGVG
jgi:hypothetical protein